LRRPTLALAIAINRAVREHDEWFDEPDELDRVQRALASIDEMDDPVSAAAVLAYRVARAQGFAEGNKRTALLLARWLVDHNGIDGLRILPIDDRDLADLLIKAAAGAEVEAALVALVASRR
jgi:prophage maintenance system killer protein